MSDDRLLFEASDGVGGRVRTDAEGGYLFDRGSAAAWLPRRASRDGSLLVQF